MGEDIKQKKEDTEDFFKEAFFGDKATILLDADINDFNFTGIVEIETGDKRGTIHIAILKKI